MNARQEPGINVEIGGVIVKLVCHDSALERRIQCAFPCLPANQKPTVTLAVYLTESLAGRGLDIPSGQVMDGEGEYVAAFDPAARRGFIRLTSSDAILALANFIRRIFTRWVVFNNGAVFHSACVMRQGPGFAGGYAEANAAYLFFGKSGAGKSTVCKLSPDATIASDDLTAIRSLKGRLRAWGLPSFTGLCHSPKNPPRGVTRPTVCRDICRPGDLTGRWLAKNDAALPSFQVPPFQLSYGPFPIRAAFTLVQDGWVGVKRLRAANALAGMLALPAELSDPEPVAKIVDLLARLVHTVPCYELHFSKDHVFWNEIDAELN